MKRFFSITTKLVVGLIILFFIVLNSCMSMRPSDDKARQYFEEQGVKATIHHDTFDNRPIRYIEGGLQNEENAPLVVFVHGAPGSYDAFQTYLCDTVLKEKARMVTIDRLGYGYSDYGNAEPSIATHAAMVKHIVDQFPAQQVLLVGHSYGGPIVAKCAMDHPDQIASVIMLAPVNDPENEQIFTVSYFSKWKVTKWMLPKALQVAGVEKFSHATALADIAEGWRTLQVPITHIHGKKDNIAPFINMEFSKQQIPADYLTAIELEEGNHFIPWQNMDVVKEIILQQLESKEYNVQ